MKETAQENSAALRGDEDDLVLLNAIGRTIADHFDVRDMIAAVHEQVSTRMDVAVIGIGLHRETEEDLFFPATREKNKNLAEYSIPLSAANSLAVLCFKQRQEIFISDYAQEYRKFIHEAEAGQHPESLIYIPLSHSEKTIGVFVIQSFQTKAYTDQHVRVLRHLAADVSMALATTECQRKLELLSQDLKTTQENLITQSKLAALGGLTAGIAHEIKNPLNFVNNFAELTTGLVQELRDEFEKIRSRLEQADEANIDDILDTMQENTAKIKEHGKRADSIVRSMLLHARGKAGERLATDLNAMLAEDINLAYHGLRAQDSTFNVKIESDLDPKIGLVDIVPQDVSRVFLNIVTNACYSANRRKLTAPAGFMPLLSVKSRAEQDFIEIRIRDNGEGVPAAIRDKLFTPFFTTKPAGQGTGLGLSMSRDIVVNGHGGELFFETEEGQYTEFVIRLPRKA
jgi:signal transduction histidine kinase